MSERVRCRKANRHSFIQSITSGDKVMYADSVVDGYYSGVGNFSPFVLRDLPIAFGRLRSSIESFSAEFPFLSIIDLRSSSLSVMNAQLISENATAYSDYVLQAVLSAMNVIALKKGKSLADGVSVWKGGDG